MRARQREVPCRVVPITLIGAIRDLVFPRFIPRRHVCCVWSYRFLVIARPAWAQVSLRQAAEAAWQRQPEARSIDRRRAESDAKRAAASNWLAESPSLTVGHRTDRLNTNSGAREWELDLGLPLKTPGIRAALTTTADSEALLSEARVNAARLRVAGEVRDLWWDARLASNERDAAARKAADAQLLAAEVEKRVNAGDLALVDLNQARATAHQAESARLEHEARLNRALRLFRATTGLAAPGEAAEDGTTLSTLLSTPHPELKLSDATIAARRARYGEAVRVTSDAPELTVGTRRDRGMFGDTFQSSVFVGVRIPLPTKSRNAPRIAAAGADLTEAELHAALLKDRIEEAIDSAASERTQSTELVRLAEARAVLSRDTQARLQKAFQLGEIDLATRLRAEAERNDAELALSRSRIEAGRAISRLNQAKGMFP